MPIDEYERKYTIEDVGAVIGRAAVLLGPTSSALHEDRYYDRSDGFLAHHDFAARLRRRGTKTDLALKGPRVWDESGASDRVELEILIDAELEALEQQMLATGMALTWRLEKFRWDFFGDGVTLSIDLLPVVGAFVEFEGSRDAVDVLAGSMADLLGPVATENYAEIVRKDGDSASLGRNLLGAVFMRPVPDDVLVAEGRLLWR